MPRTTAGHTPKGRTMTTAEKNAVISRIILAKVAEGMNVRDAVLVAGTVERVIGEVYDSLRKLTAHPARRGAGRGRHDTTGTNR